jgi:CubicO group peptidase (beta-lactamase class C family)
MKDTAFHVPPEKIDRLPAFYFFNHQTNKLDFFDDVANSAWQSGPPFDASGGGLVSTIDDYFAFCRMMVNKGRHGREEILSRATVELMTSDHLTPEQRAKKSTTPQAVSVGPAASAQPPTPIPRKE